MHARFDRVGKSILGRALFLLGDVRREDEIAADAQRADTSFRPVPGRGSQRARMGLLGRMTARACLFEMFHGTFGLHRFDDCVRKQLTFGHMAALEARRARRKRPLEPRLWMFSSGRPETVLRGHALAPMRGYPAGFYGGAQAAVVGVVVVSELPRQRSTLFFRLFGAGEVLAQALLDLAALPAGAWEREVAMEELVALRIQIPDNDPDEEERRFLMATQDLYQQWKQRTLRQGMQEGAARLLLDLYEARFGAVPAGLRAAIEAASDRDTLRRWVTLIDTGSEQEIAQALLGGEPAAPARRRPASRRPGAKARRG